jgi:hypothetical protein
MRPRWRSRARFGLAAVAPVAIVAAVTHGAGNLLPVTTKPPSHVSFQLFPNPSQLSCLERKAGTPPTVKATLTRGKLNDKLTLALSGFKSYVDFDLFTVQTSNQEANGQPVPGFTNFGLAWYQSDVETSAGGGGSVSINTILADEVFGFDPNASLVPTGTFHVGMWFDSRADAQACGFAGTTPFNGEHDAGPVAFVTRPSATTGLGPLCTEPTSADCPG